MRVAPPRGGARGGPARGAGWYRGELHAHSWNSDGKTPVAEVVAAARAYGLDFLALTDHFTNAGWRDLVALGGGDLAVLRGLELTGHAGHANLHGLDRWVDLYPDGPALDERGRAVEVGPAGAGRWDINAVARAARERGGLFCVNHPFSGDLGWRYHEFDWDLADLLEVYHHLEGPHNALQLGLWDEQLRRGRRIVGVAGTDSHHPRDARHRLGQCFTYVHAPELSEAGIVAGLRSGRVYASLGPRLDYWAATDGGGRIEMGGAAPAGAPCACKSSCAICASRPSSSCSRTASSTRRSRSSRRSGTRRARSPSPTRRRRRATTGSNSTRRARRSRGCTGSRRRSCSSPTRSSSREGGVMELTKGLRRAVDRPARRAAARPRLCASG